jgi:hypothetical protein
VEAAAAAMGPVLGSIFRKRALYYLIVIKLTPGLCITTMHTAHIQDVSKGTQAKLHIMMSNCNNAYQEAAIRKLCGQPCWEKVSLAVASSRAQTSV